MNTDLPIYKCVIDPDATSELQVEFISLVDRPAIEKNFMAFNQTKQKFAIDEERRIISGPAMMADMLIYRNDKTPGGLGEYYTVFDKDTITEIAQKFFKKGFVQNFNIMHDRSQTTSDIFVFESFVTDSKRGILPMAGFEDLKDGTWFISAKVENDGAWDKVKDGDLKGFSVEGIFAQMLVKQPEKMTVEAFIKTLKALIEKVED